MRSKFKPVILIAVAAFLFAACSDKGAATVDIEKLKPEIQKMEDAFAAGEKAKDAAAVAAYYSDDAVSYSRGEEPSVGKAAIQERIAKRLASDTTGNTSVYKIVDLFAEGDMAVEIGSWTDITPSGAEADKGFYLSYFQKRDGKYVCVRDMNIATTPAKQ